MKDKNNITPHKAYVLSLGKKYVDLTKEELKEYNRIYRSQWYPANKEEHQRKQKIWNEDNKDKIRAKQREWVQANPKAVWSFRRTEAVWSFRRTLTVRLNAWFYRAKLRTGDQGDWEEVIGLSKESFKEHIESLWVEGMSWDNWGKAIGKGGSKDVWHIDHIIDVKDGGSNHHSNLRPLWAKLNALRKYRLIEEDMDSLD